MQKTSLAAIFMACISCLSCGNKPDGKTKELPKPGAIIASAEMPVTDDTLNKFTFSIKVVADSNVQQGVYDVDVDYGPNFAEGSFTMPKGGEDLQPVIRKGNTPNTFIIGFKVPDDTAFYDYFEVTSNKSSTKMQYIKAYSF